MIAAGSMVSRAPVSPPHLHTPRRGRARNDRAFLLHVCVCSCWRFISTTFSIYSLECLLSYFWLHMMTSYLFTYFSLGRSTAAQYQRRRRAEQREPCATRRDQRACRTLHLHSRQYSR